MAHATASFARFNYDSLITWHDTSQFVVVLSVESLAELTALKEKLISNQIDITEFLEPDINNELTAFSINPLHSEQASKLVSSIPLAFQKKKGEEIVLHFNKAHNQDPSIPQWVVKYKGESHYVNHVEFKNVCFSSKETPSNPHTKGSLKFKGKLSINDGVAYIE